MLASVMAALRTPRAALGETKTRWKQESQGGLTVCHGTQKDGKGMVCAVRQLHSG